MRESSKITPEDSLLGDFPCSCACGKHWVGIFREVAYTPPGCGAGLQLHTLDGTPMNYRRITGSLATLVLVACAGAQHHYKMKKSTVGTIVIPAPEASNNTAPPDATNPFVGAKFYI